MKRALLFTLLVATSAIADHTSNARSLVMGLAHVCALDDGHATCWGDNWDDQLGDGFAGFSATPIESGPPPWAHSGESFAEVAVSVDATCALSVSGRVGCWGAGDASFAEVEGLSDAVALHATYDAVCATRKKGAQVCWSKQNYVGDAVRKIVLRPARAVGRSPDSDIMVGTMHFAEPPLPALPPTVAIVSGAQHKCALLTDGHVRCWARRNGHGEVGDGTALPRPPPVEVVGIDDAVEIVAAEHHTCVRRRGGAVACWGENQSGELGSPLLRDQPAPVAVSGVDDATHLALSFAHSCVLRKTGTIACWGGGEEGQLFDRSLTRSEPWRPVRTVGVTAATGLAAGATHSCALTADGHVACWGKPESDHGDRCHVEIDGVVCRAEGSSCGGSFIGMVSSYATPQRITELRDVVAFDARSERTCAVEKSGRVRCFDHQGPCGADGQTKGWPTDVATIPGAVEVALGVQRDCARTQDGGGGQVYCWGESRDVTPVDGIHDPTMLALGRTHACVLQRDGHVMCWGDNVTGQLGTGDRTPSQKPMAVIGLSNVVELRAGDWHTCARTRDGGVWCWGENDRGSLGDGTTSDRLQPVRVAGLPPVTAIAAAVFGSCARTADAVWCWGAVPGTPAQSRPLRRFDLPR